MLNLNTLDFYSTRKAKSWEPSYSQTILQNKVMANLGFTIYYAKQ